MLNFKWLDNMAQQNNINPFGQPLNSPIDSQGQIPTPLVPWKEGIYQKIQSKQAKFSKINIKNPGTLSNQATSTGTIGAGSTLFVVDTLTPQSPHGTEMNFAIPYVAVYEGTAAVIAHQLYPIIGASQNYGSYSITSDFDWGTFSTTNPGSVISAYTTQIHNNMGAAGTFFYVSQWKYLNMNSGTIT